MGKQSKQSKENGHDQELQNLDLENLQSSGSCSSSLSRLFGLRCLLVLLFSFVVLLSAIFWLFPHRSLSVYDADKVTESVQAYFQLNKPVSEVISYEGRLEKDIFQSLNLSNTKVTILSLNQSDSSNYTDVEFAVLPIPPDYTISKDLLTSLRLSFVKMFTQRTNLTLTTSTFGKPTSFQVLKFPGGITVDPLTSKPVSRAIEISISFALDASISKILNRSHELKDQLKVELSLEPYKNFHIQLTNEEGSTIYPPVTVEVNVFLIMVTMEDHVQQRLDHLSQLIQASHTRNLGLDNSVFGRVKNISFSTYVDGKILHSA